MSNPVKLYRKSAIERRRIYLDYSCWLEESEELTSFQATITPYTDESPLVVTAGYTDGAQRKLAMFVSGGKGNIEYIIQMVVSTDAGQIKRDDIGIRVSP